MNAYERYQNMMDAGFLVSPRHAKEFCEAVQYGKQFRVPESRRGLGNLERTQSKYHKVYNAVNSTGDLTV